MSNVCDIRYIYNAHNAYIYNRLYTIMKLKCRYCSHMQKIGSINRKCSVCNRFGFKPEVKKVDDSISLNDDKLIPELTNIEE